MYAIVEQNSGVIEVDSEVGRGTTFRIYLPRTVELAQPDTAEVIATAAGFETLLVVEDKDNVRAIVRKSLAAHGYTVLEARVGSEALEVARRYAGPIHLLLTDVVMPAMDGLKLAEQLRLIHGETRVLFMSGYTDEAVARSGLIGAGVFIHKPFTPDQIRSKVRQVLDDDAGLRANVPPSAGGPAVVH